MCATRSAFFQTCGGKIPPPLHSTIQSITLTNAVCLKYKFSLTLPCIKAYCMHKMSQLIIYRKVVLNIFPNTFLLAHKRQCFVKEVHHANILVFVSIHTSSLTFVLPKKKGGNNAAAFAIAPRRQWGKKRICVQSNRHTELNLPLVFYCLRA